MKKEERLNQLFRAIAAGSVAAGGIGCYDSEGVDTGDDALTEIVCEGDYFYVEKALHEALELGYLARQNDEFSDAERQELINSWTHEEGEPCADASDEEACLEAFDEVPREGGFESSFASVDLEGERHEVYTSHRFYYTRGDTVGVIRTMEELLELIVPVDHAKAAAALIVLSEETKDLGMPECDIPSARYLPEGILVRIRATGPCDRPYTDKEHLVLVRPEGGLEHLEERVLGEIPATCVVGRMTDGVVIACGSGAPLGKLSVADHLAEMAALEAAAVHAFRRLAEEMRALGAPESMIERAYDAADDEVRHAVMVGLEAKRRGKAPRAIEVGPMPIREALEIALENAREGMVRETYGALAAHYHALAATDPRLARLFERLAEDETRHAALSLEFGEFLEAKLSDEERRLVDEARHESLRQLDEELKVALADEVHDELGWPRPDAARSMLHEAFPAIWSQVG